MYKGHGFEEYQPNTIGVGSDCYLAKFVNTNSQNFNSLRTTNGCLQLFIHFIHNV